ncbi:hypothetical protein FSP39_018336 [Pinctada imbricata]|uniref:RING finger and SPRY domain-containing protein 1 n=1 Tax=Pinctada imbricata TaxID=66713 RepID=A0AA89BKY6_PINIB|nr:hypothetical protein FSP39_018336 [Pinctada imbricata]
MLLLHKIAESEEGWLEVVKSLVLSIPMSDPLGPAVITLLLDECPLPTKEAILELCKRLKLSSNGPSKEFSEKCCQRNIGVVLGCLAEKLAGPNSIAVLSNEVLRYLLSNLNISKDPAVILHSLVALEKFAQTSENKLTVNKALQGMVPHPLEILEDKWWRHEDFRYREVGFCAKWCLDNLCNALTFFQNREFSYEKEDLTNINVMLNSNDVSEYLKISADGLEARCDASSFESVRCTFQVDSGVWYFEVTIETDGVMQIGWATKRSSFLNHEGYGIGDDEYSMSYDGCRQLIWFKSESKPHEHEPWKAGDILGLLLDVENEVMVFSLNGNSLKPYNDLFKHARGGFFAAASFMSYQQCYFNFGAKPYRYPPTNVKFESFNDHGTLTNEEKVILPRHKKLDLLKNIKVHEDSCTLCFDRRATHFLLPCKHRGFCFNCVVQLEICPICRTKIEKRDCEHDDSENSPKSVDNVNTSPSEIYVQEVHQMSKPKRTVNGQTIENNQDVS